MTVGSTFRPGITLKNNRFWSHTIVFLRLLEKIVESQPDKKLFVLGLQDIVGYYRQIRHINVVSNSLLWYVEKKKRNMFSGVGQRSGGNPYSRISVSGNDFWGVEQEHQACSHKRQEQLYQQPLQLIGSMKLRQV